MLTLVYRHIELNVVFTMTSSNIYNVLYTLTAFVYRLILIAEKSTVYEKFPTPLINRLEKHFVLTETVLKPWQKEVLNTLNIWIDEFTTISSGNTK